MRLTFENIQIKIVLSRGMRRIEQITIYL